MCNVYAPSQAKLPPHEPEMPEFPFQQLAADHFTWAGKDYLILVDRFSGWLNVHHCPDNTNSSYLITVLRMQFIQFGRSLQLSSDRGSKFTCGDVDAFLKKWDVEPRLSSSYNPHSNLRAESAVKTAKRLIRGNHDDVTGSLDNDAIARAILAYRNTPIAGLGKSPAQIVFGRHLEEFYHMQ